MLKTTRVEIILPDLDPALDGFAIAHISDFHNDGAWERVADAVRSERLDLIALTGDMIDKRRRGIGFAVKLVRALAAAAPVCFATGNHESASPEFPDFERELLALGVAVLRDASVQIPRGDAALKIVGLDDPNFTRKGMSRADRLALTEEKLRALLSGEERAVVLSHHPEYFSAYAAAGASLVLAGHAHGGQWRLPMGLYAPGQGLFPKYTAGLYTGGGTAMFVSRGIGNSGFPLRLNNPPEVCFLTLRAPAPHRA